MATMVFNKSTSILTWSNFGTWSAVSGPWHKGALENGMYKVERRHVTPLSSNMRKGFIDKKSGKGYFVPITAYVDKGREGLGIHPDGNVPGTDGCIGIKNHALSFYKAIASTAPSADITLLVTE
jgi:hypothetical protein